MLRGSRSHFGHGPFWQPDCDDEDDGAEDAEEEDDFDEKEDEYGVDEGERLADFVSDDENELRQRHRHQSNLDQGNNVSCLKSQE